MYTQAELLAGIEEIENSGKHTIQNCIKLASLYTIMNHLYPPMKIDNGYSGDYKGDVMETEYIGEYGDTDFLKSIKDKKPKEMWKLMDELMSTLFVVNKSLYNSVINRIKDL